MFYDDDDDDLFYTGKRKRKPYFEPELPRHSGNWYGCCCVFVMMILAAGLGAVGAFVVVGQLAEPTPLALVPSQTPLPPTATATATETAIPSPTPSPTAIATTLPPTETATVTPTKIASSTPPHNPQPNQNPAERFEFFRETAGFPQWINITDISCSRTKTAFTLLLDHRIEDDVYYLEVTLATEGTAAELTNIEPIIPIDVAVSDLLTITVNDAAINLTPPFTGADLILAVSTAWQQENRRSIQTFNATWYNAAHQPDMNFAIAGSHPNGGGILIILRWTRSLNAPIEESSRLQFEVCKPS